MPYSQFLRTSQRFFSAVFILVWVLGCAERTQQAALPSDAVVLAFGDSVTYGVGATVGEDYPSVLAELTGWRLVNAGVSGDTAREAGRRLAPLLANHQPDLVIVELGGNDFLRQTRARQVKDFLREIIRTAHASGAVVALVAVPRLSLLRASVGALNDSPIYAELAEEEGVVLVSDIFSQVLSDGALRADEIHPNAQGYRELAQGLHTEFVRSGLLSNK